MARFFHKSEIFFYLFATFIIGVFVGSFWTISNNWFLSLILVGLFVLVVASYRGTFSGSRRGRLMRKEGALLGILIIVFSLGIFRFNKFNSDHSVLLDFMNKEVKGEGLDIKIGGYINDQTDSTGNSQKFKFRAKYIIVPDYVLNINEDILIIADKFPEFNFGKELLIDGFIRKPENFDNFDYISYLKRDGIRTVILFPKILIPNERFNLSLAEKAKLSLYKYMFTVKDKFEIAINKSIPEPNASYINGILLGSRQNIPDDLREAFSKTGTTHILAISGYNIIIIANAILFALIYFFKRKTAFWISIVAIILFTIMVGASASVVRASVMGLILLFAHGYGRLYDQRNSIVLAGGAMIWLNPMILRFDIGFQLSFLAVLGLIYLYPILNNKFKKIPEWGNMKEITLMTISAQIFVMPLLIYYFESLSLASLPANILVLPFVPYAMAFGFLAGLAGMFIGGLGALVGYIAWAITQYEILIIQFFSSLPLASIGLSAHWIIVPLFYSLIIYYLIKVKISNRNRIDN